MLDYAIKQLTQPTKIPLAVIPTPEEIAKHDYVLTPGGYIGAAEEDNDGEPFSEKMARIKKGLGWTRI